MFVQLCVSHIAAYSILSDVSGYNITEQTVAQNAPMTVVGTVVPKRSSRLPPTMQQSDDNVNENVKKGKGKEEAVVGRAHSSG